MERVRDSMKKELLKGLTEEQIAKVKACKNQDELLKLAKAEGIELTDEQLQAVNGGICTSTPDFVCPSCGSKDIIHTHNENSIAEWYSCKCKSCGRQWIHNV